jgi:hypothetical protein
VTSGAGKSADDEKAESLSSEACTMSSGTLAKPARFTRHQISLRPKLSGSYLIINCIMLIQSAAPARM